MAIPAAVACSAQNPDGDLASGVGCGGLVARLDCGQQLEQLRIAPAKLERDGEAGTRRCGLAAVCGSWVSRRAQWRRAGGGIGQRRRR